MTGEPVPLSREKLRPQLRRTDEELRQRFSTMQTTADVADLLDIPQHQFTYLLWRTRPESRYRVFEITKRRGGIRKITAPNKSIAILQNKLAYVLALVSPPREAVHGFRNGRSIVSNARPHAKQRFVLNIDLKDFFPSINFGRVFGMFKGRPYSIGSKAAASMAHLCCFDESLPQGAPTSPMVSNMVCARLDGELTRLAAKYGCTYTRYADDLTISTGKPSFPAELASCTATGNKAVLGSVLKQVIEQQNGFAVNPEKVRLQDRTQRQEVTGLTVNRRPNVRRQYLAQIRAMLHAWSKFGLEGAENEFLAKYDTKHRTNRPPKGIFASVVRGKIAFLKQVVGETNATYARFRHQLAILTGEVIGMDGTRSVTMSTEHDLFICHASEDKETVVKPLIKALQDAGVRVWVDQGQITWGGSLVAEINKGLSGSRFMVLVLSETFTKKPWPQSEMNAAISREIRTGVTCVLPLLVGTEQVKKKILETYPLVASKLYKEWDKSDVGSIVSGVKALLEA